MTDTRFEAQWISGYRGADDAEFDPDLYEYDRAWFPTRAKAEAHAQLEADKGPCGGWWRVTEQEWDANYYERGMGDWTDIHTWVEGCDDPIRHYE